MKYLGIDYGTKRIGIALSDERGTLAFPREIITHDIHYYSKILHVIHSENIEAIVLGESVHTDGTRNSLQKNIEILRAKLDLDTGLPIFFEKEWMSSIAAQAYLYTKGNIANEQWSEKKNNKKRDTADDKAAAVILQRFLDRKK